jgi:NAD(P)-dependent dehydrogenase (short-subunit alcohol dehydrogenase family)
MKDFTNKIAVVTGGASGIGRSLVRQLAEAGCHVAMCDVSEERITESRDLAMQTAALGVKVTTFKADVSKRKQVEAFRDHVLQKHETDHIHLLINNAGMTGSGSFVKDPEDEWQRVFDVCWGGVYNNTRAFLPALKKAPVARIVNVSSANGFFASVGPGMPHTSYSAAKFAVKGFTEALIEDLRVNAPNVQASVVMPGHVGTRILEHSVESGGRHVPEKVRKNLKQFTDLFAAMGLRPEQAAEIILSGVREGKWRILVGADAEAMDRAVRETPELAYTKEFWKERIAPVLPGAAGLKRSQ